jgi:hypothetical protein
MIRAEQGEHVNESVQQQPERKTRALRTFAILGAVLVIEAVAISAVFLIVGGPETVTGDPIVKDETAEMESPVELLVTQGKFQNTRTGRAYLYDTTVFIVVKKKHHKEVAATIEKMQAQINTDVAKLFRKAEPSQLLEPELSTLTRQIRSALDGRLGRGEENESILLEVLIPECQRFRSDL